MPYTIYEEYRLIEQAESNINRAWKGAHLLLFFLAFVFGSFCTFCFHMLMYLFDEKCVLFPKLLSLTSQRHNVIYEFIPTSDDMSNLPVDFVSTQWVDKSTCELPTYVPLVSGIFGLVWTTMFLMCSTGSRTLTGLQKPWRVLPPVFIFSVLMSILCIYSSIITHNGLQQLCIKLGEITGSSTCTYTVNVATLTYERRIRGVYQATRLTILTAWLHTSCWLCSALLIIARVLLVVDFQLVRINVSIRGDVDKLMEQNETQIRSVMPDYTRNSDDDSDPSSNKKEGASAPLTELLRKSHGTMVIASQDSKESLFPEVRRRVDRHRAYSKTSTSHRFIVDMAHELVDNLNLPGTSKDLGAQRMDTQSTSGADAKPKYVYRPVIEEMIKKFDQKVEVMAIRRELLEAFSENEAENIADAIILHLYEELDKSLNAKYGIVVKDTEAGKEEIPMGSNEMQELYATSDVKLLSEKREFSSVILLPEEHKKRKSSLRQASTQTGAEQPVRGQRPPKRVIISESSDESNNKVDDNTQTKKKEKQD